MIKKIQSIQNFAVFKDFNWDDSIRDKGNNIVEFKKLNIIYGRNYSGKTTISRILSSIENGEMHPDYLDSKFDVLFDDSTIISSNNTDSCKFSIKVYNRDFINRKLKFLIDKNSDITPFAIVGDKNIEIEESIKQIKAELGNSEKKSGLLFEQYNLQQEVQNENNEILRLERNLENSLKEKAKTIKENTKIFNKVTYQIRSIKSDIDFINENELKLLDESEIEKNKSLLKDEILEEISYEKNNFNIFLSLQDKSQKLIEKKIKPSKPIQDLLDDALLQQWVKTGITHHKGKRSTCAFCGQILPNDLWEKLDSHFNEESEILESEIDSIIAEIEAEKERIENLKLGKKTDFYSDNHDLFAKLKEEYHDATNEYIRNLKSLIKILTEKKNKIFTELSFTALNDNSQTIKNIEERYLKLIGSNNLKSTTLEEDQEKARDVLRLNEVLLFIKNINYYQQIDDINLKKGILDKKTVAFTILSQKIEALNAKIEALQISTKDEKKGADQVNKYLNNYFGHNSLKLHHEEGDELYRFVIKRGDQIADNLSEGECSLISFCYFMANLEKIDSAGKKHIIWIDDPISSLDNNHVFFIFSLIESVIARNKEYMQLFISTHNLEFLKYLKRLTIPRKKIQINSSKSKKIDDVEFFFIERNDVQSRLILMPSYLKKYITEFNYLFEQIYKCSKITSVDTEYECVYSFGNNLRKFLEAYLFYKYPNNTDIIVKMRKFFQDDDQAIALINRVDNELSHLEEIFDRSMKPILVPEIPKLAQFVLNKISDNDPEQYKALLLSIGVKE